jgi:hypothetical protein
VTYLILDGIPDFVLEDLAENGNQSLRIIRLVAEIASQDGQ